MDSPKTTWIGIVAGVIGVVVGAVVPLIQGGTVDIKVLGMAAVVAVLGYFSKDYNSTGVPAK